MSPVDAIAIFFLLMGLVALAVPALVLRPFGVELQSVDGRSEVRAVYGGYGVAMAAVLWLSSQSLAGYRRGILLCVAFAVLGMAAGRLFSLVIDRRAGFFPWLFLAVETVIGVALLWQLR